MHKKINNNPLITLKNLISILILSYFVTVRILQVYKFFPHCLFESVLK